VIDTSLVLYVHFVLYDCNLNGVAYDVVYNI